jgi:hypothetical protein
MNTRLMTAGLLVALAITPFPGLADQKTPPSAEVPSQPPTGAIIDDNNANRFSSYIPEPLMVAVRHGLKLKVQPTSRLDWNSGYQQATEHYSGQVRLDEKDMLAGYVSGLPFPLIDLKDPKVATKIAYNWALGPFNRDDNQIENYSEVGFTFDPGNPGRIQRAANLDHRSAQTSFLRYARRTQVAPLPEIPDSRGIEWKLRVRGWEDFSHTDCAPMFDPYVDPYSSVTLRYLDPAKPDETYMLFEGSRRVERFGYEAFPDLPSHLCWYPYWQPRTEFYTYRLLANQPVLASVEGAADGVLSSDSHGLGALPVELRSAYVLEMIPREAPYSSQQRALIYIDSEAYLELGLKASGTADEGAGVSEVEVPVWQKLAQTGGAVYSIAGLFYQEK